MASKVVLDASALIAFLREEPGREYVQSRLDQAMMSAVNYGEVIRKSVERGTAAQAIQQSISSLEIPIIAHTKADAFATGALRQSTKPYGLSYSDCACIALGMREDTLILTADRNWLNCDLEAKIEAIR